MNLFATTLFLVLSASNPNQLICDSEPAPSVMAEYISQTEADSADELAEYMLIESTESMDAMDDMLCAY